MVSVLKYAVQILAIKVQHVKAVKGKAEREGNRSQTADGDFKELGHRL